ncbi:hypothetical protein [Desulfovibrio legallii]|uniref:hypothetical protein n=1 Tax=Desulfovibrio legallii TaxID=571438 RepID=UPI000B8588F8|nr:hypothetical protein [Desulfovibrio legallii]
MKTKQLVSLIAAVAAMLWIAFLSPEMEGLSPKGKAALGVGVFGAVFMSLMVYTYWTWIGMFK